MAQGRRHRFERLSAGPLLLMTRLPAFVVPLLFAVVLFTGLLVPNRALAALALTLAALFLAWLAALSWPSTQPRSRWLRLLAIAVVLGLIAVRVGSRA